MVVTGLERGSERLVHHLFAAGDLIGWLTRAPEQVTPPPDPADRRAGARPACSGGLGAADTRVHPLRNAALAVRSVPPTRLGTGTLDGLRMVFAASISQQRSIISASRLAALSWVSALAWQGVLSELCMLCAQQSGTSNPDTVMHAPVSRAQSTHATPSPFILIS